MPLTTLESRCLAAFRNAEAVPSFDDERDAWTAFGLSTLLEAGRLLRAAQVASAHGTVEHKHDGSPATAVEHDIELMVRDRLSRFQPAATVVGEETGGQLPATGWAVAVDPVDGTWAFLTGTETYASTLAVFHDGEPVYGFVANPTSGEVAYAASGGESRVLRLALFGEPDASYVLPSAPSADDKILVNMHPNPSGGGVMATLYAAWGDGQVRAIRSPGGSPSWALVEAAKGHYVYVNLWSKRPAEPFDLAAAAVIVRGAGGDLVRLDDRPVEAATHAGPFVAGVRSSARSAVTGMLREALGGS